MNKPVKIIYDTDIGYDCDDAAALAMIHRLCDRGEAELLAVTHCFSTPYVAGCIDSINCYYGRQVPVGINYEDERQGQGVYAGTLCENFPNNYPSVKYKTSDGAADTLSVIRKTLASAEDKSVTLVVTGNLSSMARLVKSGGDEFSPLSGKELIQNKIIRTVIMGGRFFEYWPETLYHDNRPELGEVSWEWNIKDGGIEVNRTVLNEWPAELVFASYELGINIVSLKGITDKLSENNPVSVAYNIHNKGAGRFSWDQTAVLEAIRPGKYWDYHEYGKITVGDDLVTRWYSEPEGKHTFLIPKVKNDDVVNLIDDLIISG
jgi:inosine-uridine nucleoside N-ribohydrolase